MMKKFFVFAFAALIGVATVAQQVKVSPVSVSASPNDSYAEIKFDTLRHNFGTFPENDPIRKCTFTFTNTGTAPLVIHQAFASCGCTVPSYPKTPIKPGEKGKIDITYNGTGKFVGHFQKTVTIRTNAKNELVRLYVEGDMVESKK